MISVRFDDDVIGYRDGYWDNKHRWHPWKNEREYLRFRRYHGSRYNDWNHDRDSDNDRQ